MFIMSKNKFLRKLNKQKVAYLFILPALILFCVFFLVPLINSVRYSFLDWSQSIYPEGYVGFRHYINIFTKDSVFKISIINNFKLFFMVIGTQLTLPLILAMLLDTKMKGRAIFRVIYFVPVIVSFVMIAAIWKYILSPDVGLVGRIADLLNLDFLKFPWLGDYNTALPVIALIIAWNCIGYNMVIYLANLQSIPIEIVEAAVVDGANKWNIALKIKVPLLRHSFNIITILTAIGIFKIYEFILFLTNGGPGYATSVLTYYMVRRLNQGFQYAYASAISVIMTIVIVMITIIINQFIFHKRFDVDY